MGSGVAVEPDRCPDCGSRVFEVGRLTANEFSGILLKFTPSWRRFVSFRWNKGVTVWGRFYSCPSCGLVWSRIDPQELRRYNERYAPPEAKLALARFSKPQRADDPA
jgi:hypothetical protein